MENMRWACARCKRRAGKQERPQEHGNLLVCQKCYRKLHRRNERSTLDSLPPGVSAAWRCGSCGREFGPYDKPFWRNSSRVCGRCNKHQNAVKPIISEEQPHDPDSGAPIYPVYVDHLKATDKQVKYLRNLGYPDGKDQKEWVKEARRDLVRDVRDAVSENREFADLGGLVKVT